MRSEDTNRLLVKAEVLGAELISREEAEKYPSERIIGIDGYRKLIEDKSDDEIKLTLLS